MKGCGWGILREVLAVTLALSSLGITLWLVRAVYESRETPKQASQLADEKPVVKAPAPVQPGVDEVERELARQRMEQAIAGVQEQREGYLRESEAQQVEAARADARAAAADGQVKRLQASSLALGGRELLLTSELKDRQLRAAETSAFIEQLRFRKDVLARHLAEAEQEKALAIVSARSGYAVVPYRGPSGTWQRPIALECRDGVLIVQPEGTRFTLLDMAMGSFGSRSSQLGALVSRKVAQAEVSRGPNGEQVVPYILFVVRPDGIRPYYEAREQLERVGVAFGYELVSQDLEIDFTEAEGAEDPGDRRSRPAQGVLAGVGSAPGVQGVPGLEELSRADALASGPGRYLWRQRQREREGQAEGRSGTGGAGPGGVGVGVGVVGGDGGDGIGGGSDAGGGDVADGGGGTGGSARGAGDFPRGESRGNGARGLNLATETTGEGVAGSGVADGGLELAPVVRDLEFVVVCGAQGVLVHPGAYRLSRQSLEPKEGRLVEALRGVLKRRETAEVNVTYKPRITFLVEAGGQEAYWLARRQTLFSGLGWPVSLRVMQGELASTGGGIRR